MFPEAIDYVVAGYCTLLALAYLLLATPAGGRQLTRRWVPQQGLPVTAEVLALVRRRRRGRALAIGLGALAGLWPTFVILLVSAGPAHVPGWLTVLVAATAGSCVGVATHAFSASRRVPSGGPRVAHASATPMRAFVHPLLLACLRVTVLLAAASAITCLVVTGGPTGTWVALLALVVGWSGAEVTAYRVVAAPQPADEPAVLLADDALRGELIRDLYSLPALLAIGAALIAASSITRAATASGDLVGLSVASLVLVVAVCLSGLVMAVWVQWPVGRAERRAALGGTALGRAA